MDGMIENTSHSSHLMPVSVSLTRCAVVLKCQWLHILGLSCQQVSHCLNPVLPAKASAS